MVQAHVLSVPESERVKVSDDKHVENEGMIDGIMLESKAEGRQHRATQGEEGKRNR